MELTQKQLEALALGRVKGIVRKRPKGLDYKIKVKNKGWFKVGHSLNTGRSNPNYGKTPWNKGLQGIHLSPESEWKTGEQREEENYKWKGDKVGYWGIHSFIERKLGKPKKCEICGITIGRFHWHNINGKYRRDFADWRRLCPKCHKKEHL